MTVTTSYRAPAIPSPIAGLRGWQVELNTGSFATKDWDDLAATGAKLVRAPAILDYTDGTNTAVQWRAGTLTALSNIVSECAARGIRVVIGVFAVDAEIQSSAFWSTPSVRSSYVTLMGNLAASYAGNATVAAIDLLNEPFPQAADFVQGQRIVVDALKLARDAVRAADPSRWIVFQPSPNARPMAWEWNQVYSDTWLFDRVIWSFHQYEMTRVTHQGVPGFPAGVLAYPATMPADSDFPYSTWRYPGQSWVMDRNFMLSTIDAIRRFELVKRVPIYVGEFSCVRWSPNPADYIRDVAAMFNAYGWAWTYHSFRGYEGWDSEQSWSTTRAPVMRNSAISPAWNAVVAAINA